MHLLNIVICAVFLVALRRKFISHNLVCEITRVDEGGTSTGSIDYTVLIIHLLTVRHLNTDEERLSLDGRVIGALRAALDSVLVLLRPVEEAGALIPVDDVARSCGLDSKLLCGNAVVHVLLLPHVDQLPPLLARGLDV